MDGRKRYENGKCGRKSFRKRSKTAQFSFENGLVWTEPKFYACFDRSLSMIYLTNRFHVTVRLFSNRSQMTSKCGKNKKVAHEAQPSVSLMFLPHFAVLCDLLLNRRTATWNLFVLYNKEIKIYGKNDFFFKFCHFDRHENSNDVI